MINIIIHATVSMIFTLISPPLITRTIHQTNDTFVSLMIKPNEQTIVCQTNARARIVVFMKRVSV